jgi:PAS domain S-box-containing protein
MYIAENHPMGALASFISNLPIGLLLLDEGSCVKSLNPAAENIFGLGPDEIVGKRITHWVPTLSLEGYSNPNQNISNSRELVGYRKDGSRLDLDVSICETIYEGKKSFVCLAQNTESPVACS